METKQDIFSKEYMDKNIIYLEVNSKESLDEFILLKESYKNKIKEINSFIEEKKAKKNLEISSLIQKGSGIENWEDKKLRIDFYEDRISIYFFFNIIGEKYSRIEIELSIADKHKIYDWNGKIRPEMVGKNIDIFDVYKINFPSFSVNLLNGDKSSEAEGMQICSYLGREFYKKESGDGIMEMVKGFYKDLSVITKEREEFLSAHSILKTKEDNYTLQLNFDKARGMNLLKSNSVVIVFHKEKEFVEFTAYSIKSVRNKYLTADIHLGGIEYHFCNHDTNDLRYYFKVKTNSYDDDIVKDKFIEIIGRRLFEGDKVELYSNEDFDNLCMLYNSERTSIVNEKTLEPEYKEISDNYGRIKNLPK